MLVVTFALAIESLICKFSFSPTVLSDMTVVSIFMLVINSLLVVWALGRSLDGPSSKKVYVMMLLSFALKIFILFWDIYGRGIFVLPNSEGDAVAYAQIASSFAFGSRADLIDFQYFPFYPGQLYKLIGIQPITIQFINVYLSMCSGLMVYRTMCLMKIAPKRIETAMFFVCFMPNLMLMSSIYLQEALIAFSLAASLYYFTRWWVNRERYDFAIAILLSVLGAVLHIGSLVCAVVFFVLYFVIDKRNRRIQLSASRTVLLVLAFIAVIIFLTVFSDVFLRKLDGELSAESILNAADVREDGGSAYVIGFSGLPGWLDIIVNTPIRVFYFICSPLPWDWNGMSSLIAFFGSAFFYIYTVVKAFRAARVSKGIRSKIPLWNYLFVLIMLLIVAGIMFGWGVSNAGSVLRHREKFTYVCVILYAVASEVIRRCRLYRYEKNDLGNRAGI